MFVFNFPLEIFGSLGFVLCRGAGGDLPVATRPQGGAAADCPSLLSKLRLSPAGSRDRLGHRGHLGTCFPGLGRARQNLASRGRVRTLFLLSAEGQTGQPAYPPPVPLAPRLLPLCSVGPEAERRRGCFSVSRFVCTRAVSQSPPQESALRSEAPSNSAPRGSWRPFSV